MYEKRSHKVNSGQIHIINLEYFVTKKHILRTIYTAINLNFIYDEVEGINSKSANDCPK